MLSREQLLDTVMFQVCDNSMQAFCFNGVFSTFKIIQNWLISFLLNAGPWKGPRFNEGYIRRGLILVRKTTTLHFVTVFWKYTKKGWILNFFTLNPIQSNYETKKGFSFEYVLKKSLRTSPKPQWYFLWYCYADILLLCRFGNPRSIVDFQKVSKFFIGI